MLDINRNIIAALAYFDMFNYPLTRNEIFMYLPGVHSYTDIDFALRHLVARHSIYRFNEYYTLKNSDTVVERRVERSTHVARLMAKAKKLSCLLFRVPYVRGLAMYGLLSRHNADNDSDIVFFVIAAKNRLWIARTLIAAIRKLVMLVNPSAPFRMNYYVDEAQLQIAEQNLYTATEVVTLIPLQGDVAFAQFFAANAWTKTFLPNNYLRVVPPGKQTKSWLKNIFELLLNNRMGSIADRWLMRINNNPWKQHTPAFYQQDIVACRHCVKPNPAFFQPMMLHNYAAKVAQLVKGHEDSMAY